MFALSMEKKWNKIVNFHFKFNKLQFFKRVPAILKFHAMPFCFSRLGTQSLPWAFSGIPPQLPFFLTDTVRGTETFPLWEWSFLFHLYDDTFLRETLSLLTHSSPTASRGKSIHSDSNELWKTQKSLRTTLIFLRDRRHLKAGSRFRLLKKDTRSR